MSDSDDTPSDYYARLGVAPSASQEEIRRAYRRKAQETHPDRNPGDPQATERFQRVKEAYQTLRDPQRRSRYDSMRTPAQRVPDGLTINQEAPAGCGGYVWRVLAGMVAVMLFFVLEAAGVWAAGFWTIVTAVSIASLAAGLIAIVVARRFPDEATDVTLRLTADGATMWADGHTTFQVWWQDVQAVRLRDDGWTMTLTVTPSAADGLRPVPPVLVEVDRLSDRARLRLDLSETDVRRDVLVTFLREAEAVPFPVSSSRTAPSSPATP